MSQHTSGTSPSEDRLWDLVESRKQPGADKDAIDARIWELFGEDWAVMFTDLSGFSRRVAEFGIIHFLEVIHEQRRLLLPIVNDHDGLLVKAEADSFLIIFRRPERALACAIAMQHACQGTNPGRAPEEEVLLCVGLGWGRILKVGDADVWGAEVNAASKLGEDTAGAHEILASVAFAEAVRGVAGLTFEELDDDVPGTARAFRIGYARAG